MRYLIIGVVILGSLILSCRKDKALEINCFEEISYDEEIRPLFETNCTVSGCHDATAEGGFEFNSHEVISENADLILSAISHESGVAPMPFDAPKLDDELIAKFICWKNSGKLDN